MKADQNGHGGRQVTETPDASHRKTAGDNHQVSDVELRSIVVFLIGLTVMTVVVYLLMLLMFNLLNTREKQTEAKKEKSPLALSEKERLPPEPRLQSAPGFSEKLDKEVGAQAEGSQERDKPKDRTRELDQLRKKWDEDLSQGPKDKSGKPAGISIEEAMKQILTAGALPSRSATQTTEGTTGSPEDYAIDQPTAASSGRMTEKRKQ